MEILAIRHTDKEAYIQIKRGKGLGFTGILTRLAALLKINPHFHFEEEFQILNMGYWKNRKSSQEEHTKYF